MRHSVRCQAALYHAAAMAFGHVPAGADRQVLLRLHRDHCWRARLGNAAWHLGQASRVRRLIAAA